MKRFDYNEYEDNENEDYMPDEQVPDDGNAFYINEGDYINLKVEKEKLNLKLLFRVIKVLERSWFWRFRSETYKLEKIINYYYQLQSIIEIEDDDIEE